ncbi:MAG TPA: hypothetical protein VKV17_15480 [Bryobacteraceae bacterium]|nr:hypothetical protein [Bryobacteraceae bacterium]
MEVGQAYNAGNSGVVPRRHHLHGIDIQECYKGDVIDEAVLKELIRAAVALNLAGKNKPKRR